MFNSFYRKLALALLLCFFVTGIVLIILVERLSRNYQDEVEQKLHQDLAEHVIQENNALQQGRINAETLESTFHSMMILGPSFEFYVLDPQGQVKIFSAAPGKIVRNQVSLEPLQQFLHKPVRLPIRGDDPRSEGRQKIFSVAPIQNQGQINGYLYIIIGSEVSEGVADLLRNSHIAKLGYSGLAVSLGFALTVTLLLFALLTRPLRQLALDMQRFRSQGFSRDTLPLSHWKEDSGDEIQNLGATFNALANELQSQYQKVKSTDELRREMIAYVSHDLRTPLASLLGYLETWQLKYGQQGPSEGGALIQVAVNNGHRIRQLIEQLFELAHLDGDNVPLNKEIFAIAELACDVAQSMQLEATQKGVQLTISPLNPALQVIADMPKIERVITNLIDNAMRHSHEGGHIEVLFSNVSKGMLVEVKDHGDGIPADEIDHIFDAHFRGKQSHLDKKGNSGLGLAITRRILALHGSEIAVRSTPGRETVFSFTLPIP